MLYLKFNTSHSCRFSSRHQSLSRAHEEMVGQGNSRSCVCMCVCVCVCSDLGGDVAAAVSMVAQQLNADPHHRHYSLLDPAHSLDTFYTAHSDLASLSRVHTAASELAWAFSGADGHAALAPRGGFEKAPVSPLGEAWRHGSGAGSARWSIDVVPGAAHGATGAGGAEGNGNGVYSNGHGLVPPHGMLGSTGAAWESHGSSSTADRRVSTGAGSHVAEESEVKSLLALMCR